MPIMGRAAFLNQNNDNYQYEDMAVKILKKSSNYYVGVGVGLKL